MPQGQKDMAPAIMAVIFTMQTDVVVIVRMNYRSNVKMEVDFWQ